MTANELGWFGLGGLLGVFAVFAAIMLESGLKRRRKARDAEQARVADYEGRVRDLERWRDLTVAPQLDALRAEAAANRKRAREEVDTNAMDAGRLNDRLDPNRTASSAAGARNEMEERPGKVENP